MSGHKINVTQIRYGVLIKMANKYWPPRLAVDEDAGPFACRKRKKALEFANRLAEEFARGGDSAKKHRRRMRVVKLKVTTTILTN